jgi:predicted nucleic acid-binding protein
MPKADILIDSSFLYAVYDQDDYGYERAGDFLKVNSARRIIPDVILPEVTFLLRRSGGQRAVEAFLLDFASSQPHLEPLVVADLVRAREIFQTYPRAKLDFVDCCLMAMSERLDITRICTFDRRDFPIFRPRHAEFLELLP